MMRKALHLVTPFALAVLLAVGGVGFAKSRHTGTAVDRVVICTGYGLVTITLNEYGEPVHQGVPCPDSMALSGGLPVAQPECGFAYRVAMAGHLPGTTGHQATAGPFAHWHEARAPPVPIFKTA
jgi:hypothetical protein